MAFTEAQKTKIRTYLGVSLGFNDISRLESAMDLVGSDATTQDEIDAWLAELAIIDTRLGVGASSAAYTYGALKRMEDVEFYNTDESESVSTVPFPERGRMLIQRIARALGVDDILPNGDYFSASPKKDNQLALG